MANLKTTIVDGGLTEKEGTGAIAGTVCSVDLLTGSFFEVDLQNASGTITTFTISNPHATQVSEFKLKLTQSSSAKQFNWGGLTWLKWPGGTAPTLTTTNNAIDVLQFTTYDNGTSWYGKVVGQNFS
jgi:hypothetical protein